MATRGTTTKAAAAKKASPTMKHDSVKDTSEYDNLDDEWETLGEDNGDIVNFTTGDVSYGTFVVCRNIELPEDKQKNLEDGSRQTHADLLVFKYPPPDDNNNWSVWKTYQLGEVEWVEGDFYRIECKGTRKATQGEVKIFSVQRRKNR